MTAEADIPASIATHVKLPWIFPGAPLFSMGPPEMSRVTSGNLTVMPIARNEIRCKAILSFGPNLTIWCGEYVFVGNQSPTYARLHSRRF